NRVVGMCAISHSFYKYRTGSEDIDTADLQVRGRRPCRRLVLFRAGYAATAAVRRAIHAIQSSRPTPVVQDVSIISISGFTRRAFSRATSILNGTYGSRSILFKTISFER